MPDRKLVAVKHRGVTSILDSPHNTETTPVHILSHGLYWPIRSGRNALGWTRAICATKHYGDWQFACVLQSEGEPQ